MVLSRIRNYFLLQRQLHMKPKITSKVLAWETQTAITTGRVRTTFYVFDLSLSRILSITPFSLSLSPSLSLYSSFFPTAIAQESYSSTYEHAFIMRVYIHIRSATCGCVHDHLSNGRRMKMPEWALKLITYFLQLYFFIFYYASKISRRTGWTIIVYAIVEKQDI